ncbi:MAG: DUF4359 domain-containing protein [Leptolyngbyaceae cyanobacterium CSU_1_3]|nr:DUF4359 domain-containing protein [Leptolyngbyaceae cyanobacterium CSU_1_3]
MKMVSVVAGILGVGVLVGVGLAVTNPEQSAFEEFAVQRIRDDACKEMPLGLAQQCPQFVDDNKVELKKIVTQSTERRDFLIFSYYETNLSVRSIIPQLSLLPGLPAYRFETVGLFGKFYIYEAQKY